MHTDKIFSAQPICLKSLQAVIGAHVAHLSLFETISSTSTYLIEHARASLPLPAVCISNSQSAGRGRQGNTWISPPGANIYLSVAYDITPYTPYACNGLSLVVGVSIAEALITLYPALQNLLGLKWPNDLLLNDKKCGGILIEIHQGVAVIGVGLNVFASPKNIQAATCLVDELGGVLPELDRTTICVGLVRSILSELPTFFANGFTASLSRWEALDAFTEKSVNVITPTAILEGEYEGVDGSGALCVRVDGALRQFLSADVSLRNK